MPTLTFFSIDPDAHPDWLGLTELYFSAMRFLHFSLPPFFVFAVLWYGPYGQGVSEWVWVHITAQRGGGELYQLTIDSCFCSYFTPAFSSWVKGPLPDVRGSPGKQVFVVIYAIYYKQSDWRRSQKRYVIEKLVRELSQYMIVPQKEKEVS